MPSVHTAHATYTLTVALAGQSQAGNYSTFRVTFTAVCDSGWGSGSNASGIGFSATGYGNGSFSINGASVTICDFYFNAGHDANGYLNYNIAVHSNATGTSAYGGPVDLNQAGSVPRIPKAPKPGPVLTAAITGPRQITVTSAVPSGYDEGGATTNSIDITYSKDGSAFGNTTTGAWGPRVFNNLAPGSYQFRSVARNSVGNSPLSNVTAALRIVSGGKRLSDPVAGTWVALSIMRRHNGTAWVDIASSKKSDGSGVFTELVGT